MSVATLNDLCRCSVTDEARLKRVLSSIEDGRPLPFFARDPIFVDAADVAAIRDVVTAAHHALTAAKGAAWSDAGLPEAAKVAPGPKGVFFGYDFHLTAAGPKLIEINTNAGGVLLAAALAATQDSCCVEYDERAEPVASQGQLDAIWMDMFRSEWQLQRGDVPLTSIAIVDDDPAAQFLYPEFLLFAELFRMHDVRPLIVDAADLVFDAERNVLLSADGELVPMIYNRLTDFYLAEPKHAALRAAYLAGAVVLTPFPRAHAIFADKRNLVLLSSPAALQNLGLDAAMRNVLANGVPETQFVTADRAAEFWATRRGWFFKPTAGYGSKAAYRGDKLTKGRWQEVLASAQPYVAQRIAPPGRRLVSRDGVEQEYKFDVRAFVYDGEVQLLAARLYQGQTTNFRAPGSGFAPVVVWRAPAVAPA